MTNVKDAVKCGIDLIKQNKREKKEDPNELAKVTVKVDMPIRITTIKDSLVTGAKQKVAKLITR